MQFFHLYNRSYIPHIPISLIYLYSYLSASTEPILMKLKLLSEWEYIMKFKFRNIILIRLLVSRTFETYKTIKYYSILKITHTYVCMYV